MPHPFAAHDFGSDFDGDLHRMALIFCGIVRSFKGLVVLAGGLAKRDNLMC
jgi:hypothetical protein